MMAAAEDSNQFVAMFAFLILVPQTRDTDTLIPLNRKEIYNVI